MLQTKLNWWKITKCVDSNLAFSIREAGDCEAMRRRRKWTEGNKTGPFYICMKKSSFPSWPAPACGGRVKLPLTGSGSSVHASSGRCWGSSFGGLLTSRQPSGCLCRDRQQQMSTVHHPFKATAWLELSDAHTHTHTHTHLNTRH